MPRWKQLAWRHLFRVAGAGFGRENVRPTNGGVLPRQIDGVDGIPVQYFSALPCQDAGARRAARDCAPCGVWNETPIQSVPVCHRRSPFQLSDNAVRHCCGDVVRGPSSSLQ